MCNRDGERSPIIATSRTELPDPLTSNHTNFYNTDQDLALTLRKSPIDNHFLSKRILFGRRKKYDTGASTLLPLRQRPSRTTFTWKKLVQPQAALSIQLDDHECHDTTNELRTWSASNRQMSMNSSDNFLIDWTFSCLTSLYYLWDIFTEAWR